VCAWWFSGCWSLFCFVVFLGKSVWRLLGDAEGRWIEESLGNDVAIRSQRRGTSTKRMTANGRAGREGKEEKKEVRDGDLYQREEGRKTRRKETETKRKRGRSLCGVA
jgi:hypothetical protein